ncbi:hypothetical protein NQ317_014969 [Molorchus minor]|uniref:Reverse transcriptase n=1 Tax=Molorchus minor TaxID=1323400 RepID=A0ABQ9J1X3_9CUCU|nr:hypothetical protein NQ317_014969 [Molorchus minor]
MGRVVHDVSDITEDFCLTSFLEFEKWKDEIVENIRFLAALNDWVYSTLKEHWRLSRGCRQARDFVTGPDPARSIWILGRSRETLNQLVGILTGHCKLRRHLSLLGIEEDPTCPRCGEDDETSYHFVGQCEAFRRLRFAIFGSGTLSREKLVSLGWSDVLTFIRTSGRLSERIGRVNR